MEAGKRKISIALETEPGKKFKNGQSCQNCEKVRYVWIEKYFIPYISASVFPTFQY